MSYVIQHVDAVP